MDALNVTNIKRLAAEFLARSCGVSVDAVESRPTATVTVAEAVRVIASAMISSAARGAPCPCGQSTCVEPWEPGCGLGNSEEHAMAAPNPEPVSFAVELSDGSIGALGWQDIRMLDAYRQMALLRDGCRYVYAYRDQLCATLRHRAPGDADRFVAALAAAMEHAPAGQGGESNDYIRGWRDVLEYIARRYTGDLPTTAPREAAQEPVKYEARQRDKFSGEWWAWFECAAVHFEAIRRESAPDEWETRALYTHPAPLRPVTNDDVSAALDAYDACPPNADGTFEWPSMLAALESFRARLAGEGK